MDIIVLCVPLLFHIVEWDLRSVSGTLGPISMGLNPMVFIGETGVDGREMGFLWTNGIYPRLRFIDFCMGVLNLHLLKNLRLWNLFKS